MPKYICDDFNTLCTELGLECLITMDPRAYDMNYAFKNRGPHTVALFTDDWFELVPPNGDIVVKMPSDDTPWMAIWQTPPVYQSSAERVEEVLIDSSNRTHLG